MIDAVAAVGDVADINCWSGIPHHFVHAARRAGFAAEPWRLDMSRFTVARRGWNLVRLLQGRGTGGYQYSSAFLDQAEAAIPAARWRGRVLSFNQHFPRGRGVMNRGGRLVHYLDATFVSFCAGGFAEKLPARVREEAIALEWENYARSEWVVTMARWAAESATRDCGVPRTRVATILPGANFALPEGFEFPSRPEAISRARPFVLGFVGKDWKRKGLPFLLEVRVALERMGLPAVVRSAGHCPPELARTRGLEHVGFIDKAREPGRFVEFLTGCDVGCLFSTREPLGISTLEFLRAGVPVAGFTVEGVVDTLPPDAGFRFAPGASAEAVALVLHAAFVDLDKIAQLRAAARAWSPLVTWERCAAEWRELLASGTIEHPVQLWRGLGAQRCRIENVDRLA